MESMPQLACPRHCRWRWVSSQKKVSQGPVLVVCDSMKYEHVHWKSSMKSIGSLKNRISFVKAFDFSMFTLSLPHDVSDVSQSTIWMTTGRIGKATYASWLKRHSSPNLQLPLSLKSKQTPAIMTFEARAYWTIWYANPMTRNVVTNLTLTTIRTNMSERPLPLPPFPTLPLLLPPSGQSLASSTMRMHSPEVVDDYEKMWSSAHQNPIPGPRRSGLLHSWSTRWTYPGNKRTNMNGNGNFYNFLNTRTTKFTL